MRPAILSVLLALACWASSGPQAFAQERLTEPVANKLYASVVRIVATRAEGPLKRRVASGFRWKDPTHVVTAMHVVLGAEAISIESFVDGLHSVPARVVKIYPASDLALLELAESLPGMPLPEAAKSAEKGQSLWVVGFPLEVFSPRSRHLRLSEIAPAKLINAVDRTALNDLRSLGFPALDSEVLQVEGDLLHGDSGAPIVNAQGELVGIGNGGLKNGFAGLGWAIPASELSIAVQEPYADADLDATKLSVVQSYFFADPAGDTLDRVLWETALQADRLEYYQDYLERLPNGRFAALAQQHVNELTARHSVALNYFRTAVESVSLGQVVEADTLIAAYQRSKHDLEQAISLFPEFAPAYLELAITGYHMAGLELASGKKTTAYLSAIDLFSKAIIVDSNQAEAYLFRGFAYNQISNQRYACEDFITFQRLKDSLSRARYEHYRQGLRFSREFLEYNGCDTPPDIAYIGWADIDGAGGVRQDCKETWYEGEAEYCAERGSAVAMERLAGDVDFADIDTSRFENAVKWADELARRDAAAGYYHVGKMYWNASGKPYLPRLAFQMMQRAAASENGDALYFLGEMLWGGIGCTADTEAARLAWARAAVLENGNAKGALRNFDLRFEKRRAFRAVYAELLQIVERGSGDSFVFPTQNAITQDLQEAAKEYGGLYLAGLAIDVLGSNRERASEIVPVMTAKYRSLDPYLQQRVRIAFGQLQFLTPEAARLMAQEAVNQTNADARVEALRAISGAGSTTRESAFTLLPLLQSDDPKIRMLALGAIGETNDSEFKQYISPLIADKFYFVRAVAQEYLRKL